MTAHAFVISLVLLIPAQPDQEFSSTSPEDLPFQPLVALLDYSGKDSDLGALRARIERERDAELNAARQAEDEWKKKLSDAREALSALNRHPARGLDETAVRRSSLHVEIAALERGIHEKRVQREHDIPAQYESRLSRVWLAEHWPDRRKAIRQEIRKGDAYRRKHGDVEDVGYRGLGRDPEKDVPVGQQAARQMMAGGWLPPEIQDSEVQHYVQSVATHLAAGSDLKVPLHVTVLDSNELKAIALPGGYLYVTSGVIRAASTESVLAGVLSREIARIAAQHATRRSKVSVLSRFFIPAVRIVTGIFTGGASPAAYYGIGYGVEGFSGALGQAMRGSDKKFEAEADQLGIQYAWKAGYDPRGFLAFLDSISPREARDFLGETPSLQERVIRLFSEIEYLPEQQMTLPETGRFEQIRRRLN